MKKMLLLIVAIFTAAWMAGVKLPGLSQRTAEQWADCGGGTGGGGDDEGGGNTGGGTGSE